MLRDVQADLLQNLAVAVAEGHAAGIRTAEHNVPAVRDLAHSGLLVENIQHAVARGEGALQPGAEVRQRDDRAEAAHERHNADERTVKPDGTRHAQAARQRQHTAVQQQDDGPGHGLCRAAGLLQAALLPGQRVGALVDLRQPVRAVVVLQALPHAAQTVQHKAVQRAELRAEALARFARTSGGCHGHADADDRIGQRRVQSQCGCIAAHKASHNDTYDDGNADGRDRVRVKNLQQLNVRGQHGDQVALVAALQLGRGQLAQHAKDLVPDERQQLERNKMVAALLRVVQHAAGHGQNRQQNTSGSEHNGHRKMQAVQQRIHAQNRDEDGAEEARHAQKHGADHDRGERAYQPYKAAHDVEIAAGTFVFHHCASFP